jgi:16S rRNA processing protein RimM
LVAIGKIRTSHGVRGEVKVLSYSGVFDHFERLKSVSAHKGAVEKTLTVEATRWTGENLLLKFAGIDSPEEAKLLADFELWVPKAQAAPLEEGEVYLTDLIGCSLVFAGEVKGRVTGFLEGAQAVLLEVEKPDGKTCVVPFQEVYLGSIDLTGRTVELKVEWILE